MIARLLSNTRGSVRDLIQDNPVLEKDVAIALRAPWAPVIVGAGGLALVGVAALVHLAVEPSESHLANWRSFEPSGRVMFAAVAGALLALQSFLVPAFASSAIAGERERGTLPLLQLSALSPARIVAGKLASILVVGTPLLALAIPALALASLYGGVRAVDVALVALLLAVHGASLAAVGLGASSLVKRARSAAPLGMLASVGPSLVLGIPFAVALACIAAGERVADLTAILVAGVAAELLLGAAGIIVARDQLSPRSAPRWPLQRALLAAAFIGFPLVAATVTVVLPPTERDLREITSALLLFEVCLTLLGGGVLAVALASRDSLEGRTPLRQALTAGAFAVAGLFIARVLVPAGPPAPNGDLLTLGELPVAVVGLMGLYAVFTFTFAAAVSKVLRHPVARLVVTALLLGGLFVLPLFLQEMRFLLGLDPWTLGFTNPVVGIGSLLGERAPGVSPVECAVFLAASSAVFALVARAKRGAPTR